MKDKETKGKVVSAWVNSKDQINLIKRFGMLPDSKMTLAHLLNEPIKIVEIDKNTDDIIYELKKIGNNLNQIALKLNQNSSKNASFDKIEESLRILKTLITDIQQKTYTNIKEIR